jgi:23S rRNA (adenine2503-C2)-methyltransferase
MDSLYDLTFTHLEDTLRNEGIKAIHAQKLYRLLYKDSITLDDLTPGVRDWLSKRTTTKATVVRDIASSDGCTRKFVLCFDDGQEIETVLMGYRGRYTACISSQAGCAMGCVFCATGKMGFKRHLSAGEMVAQVRFLNTHLASEGKEPLRNVVMMGMGEPLHNYKELMTALEIISDPRGICIAPSRISISTVGHIPGIKKLAEAGTAYELSVSLHGASDVERDALIFSRPAGFTQKKPSAKSSSPGPSSKGPMTATTTPSASPNSSKGGKFTSISSPSIPPKDSMANRPLKSAS